MKSKTMAGVPSLRELLAAGAHYGHRRERSLPSTKQYTFVVRDGVCVINLEETQQRLAEAARVLEELASQGKIILLVGTKRQAERAVTTMSEQLQIPSVSKRWMGGTLTNFTVIRSNIERLLDLERRLADEKEAAKMKKKEKLQMEEVVRKFRQAFGGIVELTKLPDLMLVVDPHEETTAVREARRLQIPVMALCDTDADPNLIDYPIPANDDAPKTIELVLNFLTEAIVRGKEKV